jgi:hypothetical protein
VFAQLVEEPPTEVSVVPIELKGLNCQGGRFGMSMPTTVAGYRALGKRGREEDAYVEFVEALRSPEKSLVDLIARTKNGSPDTAA